MDKEFSPWHLTARVLIWTACVLALLALVGCGTTPEPRIVTEIVERRVEVPRSLLTCSAEPVAGTAWVSQRDVARYMVDLAEAGEDCRTKLESVRRLVNSSD